MALRVWIWLLSLSVLWGGSFFFAKVAIGELGPFTVVFARVALAALVLDILLVATGTNPFRRAAPWSTYFCMGLLNNVLPFSLIFWGQTHIASGLASILKPPRPSSPCLSPTPSRWTRRSTPPRSPLCSQASPS